MTTRGQKQMDQQLAGRTILLTAQRRAGEFSATLERRGAQVRHAPTLSVVPHVDDTRLLARTKELVADAPEIVIVTTAVGFRGWIEAADAVGLEKELTQVLSDARIIARGPKARGALQAHGLTADWVAESETSAEIKELLLTEGVAGRRIAVQHHGAGADGLDEDFAAAGADVVSLVVYRWGPAPDPDAVDSGIRAVADHDVDAVAFTSAPGAAAFLRRASELGLTAPLVRAATDPDGVLFAAVGSTTAAPLVGVGIDPLVPDRFRLGALVRALVLQLQNRGGLHLRTAQGTLSLLRNAALLDGSALRLSPNSLSVLRTLADAHGAVVSREQILAQLPGGSTDLHAAEMAVARLRSGLPDPAIVRTVVKRGYRLDVPVEGGRAT